MDFEEQLQEQLAEQQEALTGVRELLAADPSSEMAALLAELQEGWFFFFWLRLVLMTAYSAQGDRTASLLWPWAHHICPCMPHPLPGMRETEAALLGLKRQRLLQELDALHGGSNQQQQQGEQGGPPPDTAALAASEPAAHLRPGAVCVFRQTDGRHYFGRVLESQGGLVSLQPLFPTRQAEHALYRAVVAWPFNRQAMTAMQWQCSHS